MSANPRVFMDIEVDGKKTGHVVFELFANKVPKTAENFRKLCTGELGSQYQDSKPSDKPTIKPLHYKGSSFHRIIPGFMAQGGDFTVGNGTGGLSIYGNKFADENFLVKHTEPYMLSMANAGPNTNGSQFFITFAPTPWLDGKHTVFGKVVEGQDFVKGLEALGSNDGKPKSSVVIKNCGQL